MKPHKKQSLTMKFAQRKFLKAQIIRRNKNIFDIGQIDYHEISQQKKRRTPYKNMHTEEISQKLTQSFMNSTAVNSFKLDSQIEKHKEKVGSSMNSRNHTQCIYYDHPQSSQSKSTDIRGVCMDKMITRQYRQSLDAQDQRSEDRFNNFYYSMPDDSKTRSFDKYISRQELERLRLQTVPESNPEIPVIYQKVAYPSTTFKVSWDYRKQKQERGPVYFKVNKQNSINLNEINGEKIERGRAHSSAKWNRTLTNFLSLSSKQEKSQFERTFYPPNMDFRSAKPKSKTNKPIKIKQKKSYPDFQKWELCDVKYFRVFPDPRKNSTRLHTS